MLFRKKRSPSFAAFFFHLAWGKVQEKSGGPVGWNKNSNVNINSVLYNTHISRVSGEKGPGIIGEKPFDFLQREDKTENFNEISPLEINSK